MAEFCLECWNKLLETNDPPKKFVLSRELDLCEECGQYKRVIVVIKRRYLIKEWFEEVCERIKEAKADNEP